MNSADTIAAISTAPMEAAIALIRISGPLAIEISGSLWAGRRPVATLPARHAEFGRVVEDGAKLDDVLLTVFRAPASYTGEDMVEIACHGGVLVSRRILSALLRRGARSAEPGEFTKRAYLHGKLDLTQAEAVMDLICAQTELALGAAAEQLEGRLGTRIRALRQQVLEILAHVEAYIDFPDEDISPDTGAAMSARMASASAEMDALLATAGRGRVVREGLRTVIYGEPNVGKSSLLNLLLGYERAIVNARPGTTRDVLEETVNLRGIPVRLMDTAGVRETDDEIELEGIERTRRALDRADLVLHLFDASQAPTSAVDAGSAKVLRVLNKSDLGIHGGWSIAADAVPISCLNNTGIAALEDAIQLAATGGADRGSWSVAINARHQECLEKAKAAMIAAQKAFADGLSPEFVAEDLRASMNAVGDVVGRPDTEELLGVIFSSFCIGK
ncbi:MAG: tRNA uridine-5-carboxymethylaminomethyl(34) synthesis GTPase MnmE [Verrucomicrobiota bacterium]|jgi:tRNA modification GTPase